MCGVVSRGREVGAGVGQLMLFRHLERNRHGWDSEGRPFQRGPDRAGDGDADGQVLAPINARYDQIGRLLHELQNAMLNGLRRRTAHGINLPGDAVDRNFFFSQPAVRGLRHAASRPRMLIARCGHGDKPQP